MKSGAVKAVGMYTLSTKAGIRAAPQARAALALFQVDGVPAPVPPERPAPDRGAQARVLVSVLASLGIAGWALVGGVRRAR